MYLRRYDSRKAKPEKLHRTRMPPMLLLPISFEGLGDFTKDLIIIAINKWGVVIKSRDFSYCLDIHKLKLAFSLQEPVHSHS